MARAFGCARVVFNDALRAREEAHAAGLPYLSDGDLSKLVITRAKRTPERSWLGEVSAVVLQQALADLNRAYRNFFASLTGKRKGPKVARPRYRSRKDRRQAVRFTRNAQFRVTAAGRLRLPKIGDVRVRWSRPLPAEPSSVTVILDAAGRYYASFVIDVNGEALPETDRVVGVIGMLEYKAVRYGRTLIRIGRFEPTSQVCSVCGVKDGPKPLDVRSWICQRCAAVHDRDVNAAVNVARAAGLAVSACGARVRPGVIPAQRGEAGTHSKLTPVRV
ncbi:hypothetical protein GCM10022221_80290 [Actinocorallia aurea]